MSRSPKPDTGIKCEFPGCKYRGSFNREYDLTRHMNIHNSTREKCPVELCERTFYRYDKLLHHFATAHHDNEEAICPVLPCGMRVPLMVLAQHVEHAHLSKERGKNIVCEASRRSGNIRSCPIPSCKKNKKRLEVDTMQEHLRQHLASDRFSNCEAILAAGYDPDTMDIVCPVCNTQLQTPVEFQEHFEWKHIFSQTVRARELRLLVLRMGRYYSQYLWRREFLDDWTAKRLEAAPDFHYSILQPYSDYAHYRMAILRLWPEFARHPLFDEYRNNIKNS